MMPAEQAADLDIAGAGRALRNGALTAEALTRAVLDRIAARDGRIGAFVHVAGAEALAAARAADAALGEGRDLGPLHGIPFAVKDVFDVAGWPVRRGSALYRDRIAPGTAELVAGLQAAGAVPVGLVATYELATVGPDATSLYAQPRNPWNPAHVTGGSSSGSAAAIAAGMVRFALGSDTGGSARSPAAYCGVAGFKPTGGLLGKEGMMPLAPSMDQVGLLGATAAEVLLVLQALAPGALARGVDPNGARVAYGRDWCLGEEDGTVLSLMDDAAAALSLIGARIARVALPDYPAIEAAAATVLLAEQLECHWDFVRQNPDNVGKMAFESISSGQVAPAAEISRARAVGADCGAAVDAVLADHDVLILPTVMTPAPPFSAFADGKPVWTAMRTIPFNLTGHPALSVPMGFRDGLPMGLQIVGARGADAQVLQIGVAFETATDHASLRPQPA